MRSIFICDRTFFENIVMMYNGFNSNASTRSFFLVKCNFIIVLAKVKPTVILSN
jgi:hypothetical protein